ncbi:MAG: ASCH domain-containing protein [Sedimentibacter sp.]
MKAITIWQPWATLLAIGAKKYETRSWATNYRGPIAIHAANKPYKPIIEELPDEVKAALGNYFDFKHEILHTGAIIATAELVGCWEIAEDPNGPFICRPFFGDTTDKPDELIVRGNELLFGDYTLGRYAWEFRNMIMLDKPIPAKGKQRLWNFDMVSVKKHGAMGKSEVSAFDFIEGSGVNA